MDYTNGGYGNDRKSDFERDFKQSVSFRTEALEDERKIKKINDEKRNRIIVIVLFVIAVLGAILIVVLLISGFNENNSESDGDDEYLLESIDSPQGDNDAYKDLPFSETESNAPILVYTTVKNGEIVSTKWLEEFREASKRYAEKYNSRVAIPDEVAFGKVTVLSDLTAGLYPNENIIRFLLETSDGCARFDLYEDLSVIYDYEYKNSNCDGVEWKLLNSDTN